MTIRPSHPASITSNRPSHTARALVGTLLMAAAFGTATAQAAPTGPCRGPVFSTEESFVARGFTPPDGDPTISDGDLLELVAVGQTGGLCARNAQLLDAFDADGLGLDAADVIDPDRFLIAFSTDEDDPRGAFSAGDLLATNGAIVPNLALTYTFGLTLEIDLGLDAVHLIGAPEKLARLADELAAAGPKYWQIKPQAFAALCLSLDVDVWFSTETTPFPTDDPPFTEGDLLSAATGKIVASYDVLQPARDDLEPDGDHGLDAVTAGRSGDRGEIYLSTEAGRAATPTFGEGDLLRAGKGVDLDHDTLLAPFVTVPTAVGLDAFHGTVDLELPPVTVEIDPVLEPIEPSLPGWDGAPDRPLSAIVDPDGVVSTFVAEELIVQTDDPVALADFLASTGGKIRAEVDASGLAALGVAKTYLVAVDAAAANTASLASDLEALDGGRDGRATGAHRVADSLGLGTLALAARAAIDHQASGTLNVGVNWYAHGDDLPNESLEAASGPSGYMADAYDWTYMNQGSNQNIGVTDAWSLLHAADRFDAGVKIAILDMGFSTNGDLPNMSVSSGVPWVWDPIGHPGHGSRWHATKIAGVTLGKLDNQFGTAGVASPVAEGIGIFTTGDMFFLQANVTSAWLQGARIITISMSPRIPAILGWTVLPFEVTTSSMFNGGNTLIFGSSGNEDEDVDETSCAWPFGWPCWEKAWHTPCENNGVICVSGLAEDSADRHSNSNYGHEHVDIYGPYVMLGGLTPDDPWAGDTNRQIFGTSYGTPFVAGVAALVRAADPSLSAPQVWSRMRATAHHGSTDPDVNRIVNAYGAVLDVLAPTAVVDLTSPSDGADLSLGQPFVLRADAGFVASAGPPAAVTVRWRSNRDGVFHQDTEVVAGGTGEAFPATATGQTLSLGTHVITVDVFGPGASASDSVTINVVNQAPQDVTIELPANGGTRCAGWSGVFRGSAWDFNQTLPESAFAWSSNLEGAFATGRNVLASLSQTGAHTVTLTVTDDQGAASTASIGLTILAAGDPACTNAPPTALILDPATSISIMPNGQDAQGPYADIDLIGLVGDVEDGLSIQVNWISSVQGDLGLGFLNPIDATSGHHTLPARLRYNGGCSTNHTITLRVTDAAGAVSEDTVNINVYIVC